MKSGYVIAILENNPYNTAVIFLLSFIEDSVPIV